MKGKRRFIAGVESLEKRDVPSIGPTPTDPTFYPAPAPGDTPPPPPPPTPPAG